MEVTGADFSKFSPYILNFVFVNVCLLNNSKTNVPSVIELVTLYADMHLPFWLKWKNRKRILLEDLLSLY